MTVDTTLPTIDQRETFGNGSSLNRFSTTSTVLLSLHAKGMSATWHAKPEEWAEFFDAVRRIGRGS